MLNIFLFYFHFAFLYFFVFMLYDKSRCPVLCIECGYNSVYSVSENVLNATSVDCKDLGRQSGKFTFFLFLLLFTFRKSN